MGVLIDVVGAVGFALLIVAVHEHGHRLAAHLAGVPADHVRVALDSRPPHTALRAGDRWLAPDDDGYQAAFRRHQPHARWAWAFVAGGLIGETALSAAASMLLVSVGAEEVAVVLAATTLALFVLYLAGDLALTRRRRTPAGDHSALWHLQRHATAALLAIIAAIKTTTLLIAW